MQGWTAGEARAAMAAAPLVELDSLLAPGPVAVVAPHPDDESLGCGGLIALCARAGRAVSIVVLTDGAGSHPASRTHPPARLTALRQAEATAAAARLGAPPPAFLQAPDGALASHEAQVEAALCERLAAAGARTVLAPWSADPHPDHQAAYRIATRAAASVGARLLAYPVWGLTLADDAPAGPRLAPQRLDVRAGLERKRAAVAAHRSQITGLIADDPTGFRLTAQDLARHDGDWEVYLAPP